MFERQTISYLLDWKDNTRKKPLVLRGARQTGKTTLVRQFSKHFSTFIELNLEKEQNKKIFSQTQDAAQLIKTIEMVCGKKVVAGETLLFIDEIQNSDIAIKSLRYFYEEIPELHVIAAGSSLEIKMKSEGWSFPVGRVEFLYLYPIPFSEFLAITGHRQILEELQKTNLTSRISDVVHEKLINLFIDYLVVGGMPESVAVYLTTQSYIDVKKVQLTIHESINEDFPKYAKEALVEYLQFLWNKLPFELGRRIKYSTLTEIPEKAKKVVSAFNVLHAAMLVERSFPTSNFQLPLEKKTKSAPKAFLLDVGLCSQVLNLTAEQIREQIMRDTLVGGLMEAFVHQELLALDPLKREQFFFWVREEKDAVAETDFFFIHKNALYPIEVKHSSHGSLKSLHQFLKRSGLKTGVRVYSGPLKIEKLEVHLPNSEMLFYNLLSIPFYLLFRLQDFITVPSNP